MTDKHYTIQDKDGKAIAVIVRRDKRLKKSSRWQWQADGSILLRVPYRLPKRQIPDLLKQVTQRLDKRVRQARRRTDADLQQRAELINRIYFEGNIEWKAIRWVGNMNHRLGSCTNGGSTDGHIRISDKIKNWPQWVVDYVIAHELVHRQHSNHSKAFWDTLAAGYPKTERARGFIQGIGYAEGQDFEAE
jgi:predicted metal-dependent hydrolase